MNKLMEVCLSAQLTRHEITIFTATREYTGLVFAVTAQGVTLINPFIIDVGVGREQYSCQDFFIPLSSIESAGVLES